MEKSNVIHLHLKANLLRKQNFAQVATQSNRSSSVIASGALATTLALVVALNFQMSQNETSKTDSGRGPASAKSESVQALSTNNLAQRLSEKWRRQPASFGRTNQIEQLRTGFLEGKYAVRVEAGKIVEIEFDAGALDRPKYIQDKEAFLARYSEIIGPDFQKSVLLEQKVEQNQVIARYQLIGPSSGSVAEVTFKSDESDRLISLKVQK